MRSHNLVVAALAALTDLGAVAAPVNARGVNDANNNPNSLQILSNKIPSNFRLEASALVLPSPEEVEEQASQGGSGVEITRTGGDEDTTVLRTHDVVPLGGGGNNRNGTASLTRPLLAGGGGQASPLGLAAPTGGTASSAGGSAARAGGGVASASGGGSTASAGGLTPPAGGFALPAGSAMPPWAHAADNSADSGEAAPPPPQQQQQEKRADSPLAGIQELPGQAIKLSNAPVPAEVVKMPTEAIEQAAAALPDNPSPAGAVAATQEMQEMPAQAMAAAGGMIPAAAAAAPQQRKQKRGETSVGLPALTVDPAEAKTDILGVHVFNGEEEGWDKDEPKQKRGSTSVTLPALHMDSAEVTSNAVGLNIFEKRQQHAKRQGRENTAEGCRRHAAELGPNRNSNSNNDDANNGPAVVQLRPVAQVEPVASLRPAADIKLPSGAGEGGLGLVRTLGLQARDAAAAPEQQRKRQIFVNLPRPRPRPSSFIPPIVVAPQVRPAVGLQRRAMRRGTRTTAA